MSLGITIDVNGQVIERIEVRLSDRTDDLGRYTVTELSSVRDPHEYRNAVIHRRSDGALKLVAKACERVMKERSKRGNA